LLESLRMFKNCRQYWTTSVRHAIFSVTRGWGRRNNWASSISHDRF